MTPSSRSLPLLALAAAALAFAPAALAQAAQGAPKFTTPDLPQVVKTAKEFVGDYKAPRNSDGRNAATVPAL